MRRVLAALLITFGVVAGGSMITAGPASAASWCYSERVNFTDRYGPADYKVHTYQQCNVSGSGGTYATMTYRIHHCGLLSWTYWSQHIGAVYQNPTAFGWCT